jgi:hypothetical protein
MRNLNHQALFISLSLAMLSIACFNMTARGETEAADSSENEVQDFLVDELDGKSLSQAMIAAELMERYSKHPKTNAMVRYGINHATHSRGLCLRGVKRAMTYGGRYFMKYPGVAAAVNFGPELKRIAFRDILRDDFRKEIARSMTNIPLGCIAVYKGVNLHADRNAKYGHIEIRTLNGFVSDYQATKPRTGSWDRTEGNNRRLISVFCKVDIDIDKEQDL